jgi:uncharacterized protein YyaL (SSP411 family)
MQHLYTNDLVHETSPYLLQHALNPVQWFPWGEKALQKAKEEDKPVLVSIGYAACHWCHVMERESFENEATAAFMNAHFVNIKIDREERPDLDQVYMDAVQAMSGSGGWPLNVFLTTDARPFFGGTYFPPLKAYNRSSWMDVLQYIHNAWQNRREEVEKQAADLLAHIQSASESFTRIKLPASGSEDIFQKDFCKTLMQEMLKNADKLEGGFGRAPKFPQTFSIQYLLACSHFFGDKEAGQHATHSLKCMLQGGIYDQLAGGMARYSTDDQWLAPHFEKMLYDNALLVSLCCDAFQLTGDEIFSTAIQSTLQFCINELSDEGGGFYAAIDADSEGEEGKFYVWEKKEIEALLGNDATLFCAWYGVTDKGNWEGKNILHYRENKQEFADENSITIDELNEKLAAARKMLLAERNKRKRPQTDDKILLGWNALLLTAFCKAAGALGLGSYREQAIMLYEFIRKKFSDGNNIIYHSYTKGLARHPACLDDYAYLVQALIALQELTGEEEYLQDAKKLVSFVQENFIQEDSGFFYYTHQGQTDLIVRKIDLHDGATASGNSTMAENLLYLSVVFDHQAWAAQAKKMIGSLAPAIRKYPNSFACWAMSVLKESEGKIELAITGLDAAEKAAEILKSYMPNKVLQYSMREKDFPMLKDKSYENQSKIYVCKEYRCLAPVLTVMELTDLLKNKGI